MLVHSALGINETPGLSRLILPAKKLVAPRLNKTLTYPARILRAFDAVDGNVKQKFVLLPHTTDAFIQANGRSLEELFENSALGLFDVMTDTSNIEAARTDEMEVVGRNDLELLYNWLEALLVKFETESIVYGRFNVNKIYHESDESLRLKATIQGEEFNRKKHLPKVEVKAVTYHQMIITKNDGLWQAQFILDL